MWLQSDGANSNRRAINHSNLSILEGLSTSIGSHLTREPTTSPVSTKWWKSELMLATNFGSLCPKVTNFGSQNFGYQILFCTRLLMVANGVRHISQHRFIMMTSSNGNNFRVTGPLWGESTGHRWISPTEASDAELWCFLWSAPEPKVDLRGHRAHYDVTIMRRWLAYITWTNADLVSSGPSGTNFNATPTKIHVITMTS